MSKIIHFLLKLLLPKHRFRVGDLVYKDGTRTLYEVDSNYYNTSFDAITIVRPYPIGTQVFGIDKYDIQEFREFKKPTSRNINTTESDVGVTAHDNDNFGRSE